MNNLKYHIPETVEEFNELINTHTIISVIIDGTSCVFSSYDPDDNIVLCLNQGTPAKFYLPTMLEVYCIAFCAYPNGVKMQTYNTTTEYLEKSTREVFVKLFRAKTGTSEEYADAIFYSLNTKIMDTSKAERVANRKADEFLTKQRNQSIY